MAGIPTHSYTRYMTTSVRSPRPASVASYRSSSPRHPSPLNPSPNSFSPLFSSGNTPRNSPVDEMSDTLSPLRDSRLDLGLSTSPRSSPVLGRPRTSSFSRSPERSPVTNVIPLQPHRAYTRQPTPGNSPFAQGMPFPASPPLSSSTLAGPSPSLVSQTPRSLSPACNSPRQGSPASTYSTRSPLQPRPLCSPPHPTQSHFQHPQSSPVQAIPSPPCYLRTQSLIQQSFGNAHPAQVASSSDSLRSRGVSLDAESLGRPSTPGRPAHIGQSSAQDTSSAFPGDATPLNEAPTRWWGGRRGWVDEWDNSMHQSQTCNACAAPGCCGCDDATGVRIESIQSAFGDPSSLQEPFGRGVGGPGAFLDEEIRASFDGLGALSAGFADPLTPGIVHAPMGADTGYLADGSLVPGAVLMPAARSRMRSDSLGCGELNVGPPPPEGGFAMQKLLENSTRRHSYHVHLSGNASGSVHDGATSVQGQEPGHGRREREHLGGHGRRFSDASTHSSASYASCMSGPSQSQSQSLLMSPSQSHTSTCPSLSSLGVGIEEAEREGLRSRTFWKRRNSGSTMKRQSRDLNHDGGEHGEQGGVMHTSNLEAERAGDVKARDSPRYQDADSKQCVIRTHQKDAVKHGSMFFRISTKHGDVSNEQAHREGYDRAERCVSLAITSILPAKTIAMLSPVGEVLVRAKESAKFVGHEIAPVVKDTLSISADIFSLAPLPGLEEAAKALLRVWDACQKVDTNRLSCLRLAERCATLLYSVRCEMDEAGRETTMALSEPVQRLCGALGQIHTFLETQLHRPFLKRYVKREEIARELVACNEAITDAASRFGTSVQIRTYHAVCSAAIESKRFAQEAQALLSLDHQMFQRQCALISGQQVQSQSWRNEAVGLLAGNALGLTVDSTQMIGRQPGVVCGGGGGGGNRSTVPPTHGQPPPLAMLISSGCGSGSEQDTPTSSILPNGGPSDAMEPAVSAPPTPTPARATFFVETQATTITTAEQEGRATDPVLPMRALAEVHRAQDSVDAAVDEAALRGTLAGALHARDDVQMVRCLQVARGEIPEATETLRRMLGVGADGNERVALEDGHAMDGGNTELDRKFMQSGIEAMTRLTSIAKQPRGEGQVSGGTADADDLPELPSWTITRYEVTRTRKIGVGFFSDVYLGHWRKRPVTIKVLAHGVSREAFVRHIELWNALDHPNVLPLHGASSAVGEKPWFIVTKFCSGDNLVVSLKRAKVTGRIVVENGSTMCLDPLRCMHEIAKGMAYLHEHGILHGDLRAANVLVDENGQCVLSDFSQCEIKAEAHRSCGQPESHPVRWRAPEMLVGDHQPTNATDVYAFAMCCVEILGMGDLHWATLDDKAICQLVLDKDERPLIPAVPGYAEVADAVASLVRSCWVREPERRPSFASVAATLEEIQGHAHPRMCRESTPVINTRLETTSTESSPADEQYETAQESMTDVEEEGIDDMIDVPLTSPGPVLGRDVVCSAVCVNRTRINVSTRVSSGVFDHRDEDTPTPSPVKDPDVETRNEENYRLLLGTNHAFHSSLTLPLWSPTRVEVGAVGYLCKPKGEFVTLFNAIDPLQSCEERLRCLPSMYGYGKFEVQKREDGKRSVAQRGLDALSGFLTFKTRGERTHLERIARQYAFPLVQGKPSAQLCVEKTVHRYVDHLEAPVTWFKQHVDIILEVYALRHVIQREDLILVVGTLDAPDWAVFVSDDHSDGRAQLNVFANREKGEPWGMYTVEQAVKTPSLGTGRWVDVSQGTFASKVSCITLGGHDVAGDTVMLAGLRFEQGMEVPTVM